MPKTPRRNKPLRYQWLRTYMARALECSWPVISAMDRTRPSAVVSLPWYGIVTYSYNEIHAVGQPIWSDPDGSAEYRQNGVLHRTDGPAIVFVGCGPGPYYKAWHREGKLYHSWSKYKSDGQEFWSFPSTE